MPKSANPIDVYLLVRGKPVAALRRIRKCYRIQFANWEHRFGRDGLQTEMLNWAYDYFATGDCSISKLPEVFDSVLLKNELEMRERAFVSQMSLNEWKHRPTTEGLD